MGYSTGEVAFDETITAEAEVVSLDEGDITEEVLTVNPLQPPTQDQ